MSRRARILPGPAIAGAVLLMVVSSTSWGQPCPQHERQKLTASDGAHGDRFGVAVSVEGDRLVVGSEFDDSSGIDSGSAYVFRRDDNGTPTDPADDSWVQEAKLTASDAASGDTLGLSVAIGGDRVAVGAANDDTAGSASGAAYVFRLDDNSTSLDLADDFWIEEAKLLAVDAAAGDHFGWSVALADSLLVVGAPFDSAAGNNSGSAHVFRLDDNATPTNPADDAWLHEAKLTSIDAAAGDRFGLAVSVSGDRVVIGARGDDHAGANAGSAYVFRRDDHGTPLEPADDFWTEEAKLIAADAAPGHFFGIAVSLSDDQALVGAIGDDEACATDPDCDSGAAYVFGRDDNDTPSDPSDDLWFQEAKLVASDAAGDDRFGGSVAVSGARVIVGAWQDDDAGSAYVFERQDAGTPTNPDDDFWIEQVKLTASDVAIGDQFGFSVSTDGGRVVVGADQAGVGAGRVGAVYVFDTEAGLAGEDCNGNGIADECDLARARSKDCNGNDIPDECDLADDTSTDCNHNATPDECDRAAGVPLVCPVFEFVPTGSGGDFKINGNDIVIPFGGVQVELELLVSGWGSAPGSPLVGAYNATLEGDSLLGVNADPPEPDIDLILPTPVNCNSDDDCPEPSPPPVTTMGTCGVFESHQCDDSQPAFVIVTRCFADPSVICRTAADCGAQVPALCIENPEYLFLGLPPVCVLGGCCGPVCTTFGEPEWLGAASSGGRADPGDGRRFSVGMLRLIVPPDGQGTYTIALKGGSEKTFMNDENGFKIPGLARIPSRVTILGDCNQNGVADNQDIAEGTSDDCNRNDRPDECDVTTGRSEDCNGNGLPDECDIVVGTSRDCNRSGRPDECDIADGFSDDCNSNDIPDDCDVVLKTAPDCNGSGRPDECDIADGFSDDCNTNGIPDDCDLTSGLYFDDNANAVPDQCEQRKNRYISFVPDRGADSVAYRVELIESEDFPGSVGLRFWVAVPSQDGLARLTNQPVFRDWSGDSALINVGDCPIVPTSAYEIRSTLNGITFSDPIVRSTIARPGAKAWADVSGQRSGFTWEPADGIVNVNDVQASLQTFLERPGAPPVTWVDLDGERPNGFVNVSDVQFVLLAFQGRPYPFRAPADCP